MHTKTLTDLLKESLKRFKISNQDFYTISSFIQIKEMKKNESFCTKGKICSHVGILLKGILMAHYDTEKKDMNVSRFFFSPNNIIVTGYDSFRNQTPSTEEIVAIENSTIACISFDNLNTLYDKIPSLNKIGRFLAEESYVKALQRIHDLQALDSKQRVIKFYRTNKALYNLVQKQHISSYLRVNRNDLSKIISII